MLQWTKKLLYLYFDSVFVSDSTWTLVFRFYFFHHLKPFRWDAKTRWGTWKILKDLFFNLILEKNMYIHSKYNFFFGVCYIWVLDVSIMFLWAVKIKDLNQSFIETMEIKIKINIHTCYLHVHTQVQTPRPLSGSIGLNQTCILYQWYNSEGAWLNFLEIFTFLPWGR